MRWLLYFIPALIVELVAWVLTPLVCLFVVKRQHTDIVKRTYNKATVTLEREFLPDWLSLFGTPDNAVDEFWWGAYDSFLRDTTQEQYDNSWWIRYAYRVMWLFRNTAYGWHYFLFSRPEDEVLYVKEHGIEGKGFWWEYIQRKSSWKLEYHLQIPFTHRYIHGNIGWKGHRGDDLALVMYANRVIGLRKYK
jgi:hypothetical protein